MARVVVLMALVVVLGGVGVVGVGVVETRRTLHRYLKAPHHKPVITGGQGTEEEEEEEKKEEEVEEGCRKAVPLLPPSRLSSTCPRSPTNCCVRKEPRWRIL